MEEDDSVRLLLRERENVGWRYAEVPVWSVPESDRNPDGVKYSYQYGELNGNTIVRYDTLPDHLDAPHHHKHERDGSVDGFGFEGVWSLYQRFKSEVNDHGHDWN